MEEIICNFMQENKFMYNKRDADNKNRNKIQNA